SVIWKLIFNNHSTLRGVGKKIKRNESELIIFHKVDTTLDIDYLQRIKPIREYQSSWDANRTSGQWAEFEYDTAGNRTALEVSKSEFEKNRLIRRTSIYNTASLKGEFVTEYVYNDRGLLQLKVSKHDGRLDEVKYEYDEHGNCITHGGFTYRFLYDKNGNWITKQGFYKKGSVRIINGVVETKKHTDSWITEEERKISYFE
ncbi:MAG TPA: hypothetical protein VGK59_24075, partial [Ohtaekwangia sp.]